MTLPRDIGLPLLVGVVIAGAITALVPQPDELKPYLGGVLGIVLAMALGVPLYVCASASVPIAAGLIHLGASPGAALAFLIAGPATNAATITTVWKLLGGRTAVLYLVTIALSAVGGGLLLNWLMLGSSGQMLHTAAHVHEGMAAGWLSAFWAVLLLAVLAYSYAKRPPAEPHAGGVAPESLQLAVAGMTCGHCVAAVTRAYASAPACNRSRWTWRPAGPRWRATTWTPANSSPP